MSTTMNSFNIKSNRQKEEQEEQEPVEQEIDELAVQYEQDLSLKTLSQINNIQEQDISTASLIFIKLDFTLNSLLDL